MQVSKMNKKIFLRYIGTHLCFSAILSKGNIFYDTVFFPE